MNWKKGSWTTITAVGVPEYRFQLSPDRSLKKEKALVSGVCAVQPAEEAPSSLLLACLSINSLFLA